MSTSATAKKLTKRDRYAQLLALNEVKANPDLVAFIEHEVELLARKNTVNGEKALTPNQIQNENFKVIIAEHMASAPDRLFTVTELNKEVDVLNDLSNQRISAILRQMVDAGKVEKVVDKRKSYFRMAR